MKFENKGKWLSQIQESKQINEAAFNFDKAKKELQKLINEAKTNPTFSDDKNKVYSALDIFARQNMDFVHWSYKNIEAGEPERWENFMIQCGMWKELYHNNLTSKQISNIKDIMEQRYKIMKFRAKD